MAQFLRGKLAGIQRDLSQGVTPDLFLPDDLARYGVNSLVSALAYEPIQSLLAVGTSDSQFGPGQIYVYGQKSVCVTLQLKRTATVRELQFAGNRLICRDSKNDVTVFDLETRRIVANYTPPGHISAMVTDPSLDYCLTGLQNGEIVAYDLDRSAMTAFKIPNLWQQDGHRARLAPVISLQLNPRDVGRLLIGYPDGAVIYTFKQNKASKYFQYEIPRGAPGGDGNAAVSNFALRPKLTHAIWHPSGTFILTAHEDSSLAFWDARDGRLIHARSIEDVDVNVPRSSPISPGRNPAGNRQPYSRIAWCAKDNPDDTGLLIAGGTPVSQPAGGLTWIELGVAPTYKTSTWELLANHFRNPKRTYILPTPPNAEVIDFMLLPRTSPHFAGAQDPIAIMVTLSSGELVTMSFPSGHPISPSNQLHVSLSLIHPFVTKFAVTSMDRTKWLGLRESRQRGPNFVNGGAEVIKPVKRSEARNIIQVAHADGSIRVWDCSHGDDVENSLVLQADLARALSRWDNISVTQLSMSGITAELSVGLATGEVVIFRYNRNANAGKPPLPDQPTQGPGRMTDIASRADPALKEGLLPFTMTNDQQGPVTALKHSDVGFMAAGYQSGGVTLIDLRGPAIIHTQLLTDVAGKQKKSVFKAKSPKPDLEQEWATVMEFGVMTLEGDDYSSVALFVGTNRGRVVTFKILPSQSGRYTAEFAGTAKLSDDPVNSISPIQTDSGVSARANGEAMGGLRSGQRIEGALVVTTTSSAHIFKPADSRGASKTFDGIYCDSATVAEFEIRGFALLCLFGDGTARAYSIPALKEIGNARVDNFMDIKRFRDASITSVGDIVGFTGPSELAVLNVWGTSKPLPQSNDRLADPAKPPIPRPTISNLEWISGTQYITPSDMDILIGGPDRPPSKRMLAEMKIQQELEAANRQHLAKTGRPGKKDEGYWAYMQRQIQERTDALGLTGDSMDRTAESTATWSDDVNKYVAKQKKAAVMGFISKKIGL